MLRFAISAQGIDAAAESVALKNAQAGAMVTFEGWIRNHNKGHAVSHLEYEVFEELATSEGERILQEAVDRFGLHGAVCVHRSGALEVSDIAVWVGVTAAHRAAAYNASRYIIDEVKARLPIWKRESYADGRVEWVNCLECAMHVHAADFTQENTYYDRQIRLPEIGRDGQDKLRKASVLIVGVGGLGAAAAQVLAGSGIGRIRLCDFDRLQLGNLHRQFLYSYSDTGKAKAELAAERLHAINPFVEVIAHTERFIAVSADRLLKDCTLVLDCTDNLRSKFDLNDACVRLGVPLVSASLHRWDGELAAMLPDGMGGCLRCLWPDLDESLGIDTCSEGGVHSALPALLGNMQALEATKLIMGQSSAVADAMMLFDALTLATTMIGRNRRANCRVCGNTSAALSLVPVWALSPADLEARSLADFQILDLRTLSERQHVPGPAAVPVASQDFQPSPDKTYLAFCAKGERALSFTDEWRARGWNNIYAAVCTPGELMQLLDRRRS